MAGVRPFQLRKLGHVVLNVTDIEAAVRFYTQVLGLSISDRYPDSMVPGGMVFMRYGTDHHGVALVGGSPAVPASSLNHFAFEVGTLAEVFDARAWLREHGVPIVFEGRRRAGCTTAHDHVGVATNLESTGTSTRSARRAGLRPAVAPGPHAGRRHRQSGRRPGSCRPCPTAEGNRARVPNPERPFRPGFHAIAR
jgi:catechol 2,3-dioxygenase-like lactoylglutathione lyase family enzyme